MGNANAAGLIKPLKSVRCPSDDYEIDSPRTSYAGSMGPQCADGGCGFNYQQQWCTNNTPVGFLGYQNSADHGNDWNARGIRGVFSRLGGVYGAWKINFASVRDGLSNTIFAGDVLPGSNDHLAGNIWAHFNGGAAHVSTIVPINTEIEQGNYGCSDAKGTGYTMRNWNVSWGFRSNHTNGAMFLFGDGAVKFINQSIDMRTYQLLGCRNDRLPVTLP